MTSRTAIDTSVAVPLLVVSHQAHHSVTAWARGRDLCLSGHALAETYSVLTRLPGDARVSGTDATLLLDDNFSPAALLPPDLETTVHHLLARSGIRGGATYDGLVALAAHEAGLVLATRDARARSTYEAIGVVVEIVGSPAAT